MRLSKTKLLNVFIFGLFIGICIQSGIGEQNIEYGSFDLTNENRVNILTLRPNAAGVYNQHYRAGGYPGDQYNYLEVDEEIEDDDSSYIYDTGSGPRPDDFYNIPNGPSKGPKMHKRAMPIP